MSGGSLARRVYHHVMATLGVRPAGPPATHEVANQPPPLDGPQPVHGQRRRSSRRWSARARGWARERAAPRSAPPGAASRCDWGCAGQRAPAGAAHARPLRPPHRRGRVPPGLAPAHGAGLRARAALRCRGRPTAPGAHVARAALYMTAIAGRGRLRLPDHDDLRRRARAARAARARRRVGAAADRRAPTTASCARRPRRARRKCGMAMTEKQGGSDVRANTTRADAAERRRRGRGVRAAGHKWFCSAPMCDLFLVLAQTDEGVACFAVPRDPARRHAQRLPPAAPQGQARQPLQRLERGRVPRRLGAAGRRAGPRRADDHRDGRPHAPGLRDRRRRRACAAAVASATWHAAHRSAFGTLLADQPLMQQRARRPGHRVRGGDRAGHAPRARLRRGRRRRPTQLRGWPPRSASTGSASALPAHAFEALECLRRQRLRRGVRDAAPVPRGAAELDLGGLGQRHARSTSCARWRATPEALEAFLAEVDAGGGRRPRAWTRSSPRLRDEFADPEALETRARRLVERLALALQGSLLVRHAPAGGGRRVLRRAPGRRRGPAFGTLPGGRGHRGDRGAPHAATMPDACRSAAPIQLGADLRDPHRRQPELVHRPLPLIFCLSGYFRDVARRRSSTDGLPRRRRRRRCCFFVSLVLHELGHALVARRNGHRDRRHRPVVLRRPREAQPRHRTRPARSSGSPPPGPAVTLRDRRRLRRRCRAARRHRRRSRRRALRATSTPRPARAARLAGAR